jgi:uncharacterized protein YkwD
MSRPDQPRYRGFGQAARALWPLVVGAVLFLAAGLALGWLVFGRGQDRPQLQPATPNSATTAVVAELPSIPLAQTKTAVTTTANADTIAETTGALAAPVTPAPPSGFLPPGFDSLQLQALDLINQSRTAEGLGPVAWDDAAAAVAQAHAEDMLDGPFFSHWNRAGYGPDHRAALTAGMTDAFFENIHMTRRRTSDDQPAPIVDWPQRILDAHLGLMDSPGHRRNIMNPAHTHVGVGIAYRPEIGELRLVQEFVNRYVALDSLPAELPIGAEVEISGRLLNGASDPLINLAYEPFLQPMSLEQLNETSSYTPAAQFYSAPRTVVDGDRFHSRAIVDFDGQPGLYHLWIFVTVQGEQVMAAAPIIAVR